VECGCHGVPCPSWQQALAGRWCPAVLHRRTRGGLASPATQAQANVAKRGGVRGVCRCQGSTPVCGACATVRQPVRTGLGAICSAIRPESFAENLFTIFWGSHWSARGMLRMLRMRSMGSCPTQAAGAPKPLAHRPIGPISLQPFGQVPWRAVCGGARLVQAQAIHCAPRPASIPGRYLCDAEKILNTF